MIRSLIALVALSFATVSHAVVPTSYQEFTDGWSILSDGETCYAARTYEGGDILLVNYQPSKDRVTLSVSDPDATSLKAGQKVTLYVTFVGVTHLDEDWGSSSFDVYKDGQTSQMVSSFVGHDMLADLGRYAAIAFTLDGTAARAVGVYNLDGSARAMASLRQCAFAVEGLNPNDPFLR